MSPKYSESLFAGAAWYYARYRTGYPRVFLDYVVKKFHLDGRGKLLDLGCGTGQLAIPLARYFEEVVAVDPDKEMLREAKRLAEEKEAKNISWKLGLAEEFGASANTFRLATMGASFHWMNREKVLETLYKILEPGGGAVIVWMAGLWEKERLDDWQITVKSVVQRWLGEKRRAGAGFYEDSKERHEDIIARSPFKRFETFTLEFTRDWDLDGILGHLYSTSYSSKRMFGDRVNEFEDELKSELRKLNLAGKFQEHALLRALIIRKSNAT